MTNYKFDIYNEHLELSEEFADELPVCLTAYGDKEDSSFDLFYIDKSIPDYANFSRKLKQYLNEGLITLGDLDEFKR